MLMFVVWCLVLDLWNRCFTQNVHLLQHEFFQSLTGDQDDDDDDKEFEAADKTTELFR